MTLADGYAQRDNNFNLIRLVAAWLVIYGHSYAVTAAGGQDLLLQLLRFKFAGGIAVDVFFVISGFLITASLERNSLGAYLMARALRILPALFVCVLLSALLLGPLMTSSVGYFGDGQVWRYIWVNASLTSTEYFLPGVFDGLPNHAINGSLWSLPIEARLYLVVFGLGLLGLLKSVRFNPLYLLTMILGFLILGREPLRPDLSNYAYCTAFFLTGAFAWVNRARIPLSWPVMLAVVVFAAALHGTDRFHIGYFALLSYGTLFIAMVPRLPTIRRHDLSYGMYLYGWPAQQLVQSAAPDSGALANTFWATLLAGALAAASWWWVEAPALRLKRRFGARADSHAPTATSAPITVLAVDKAPEQPVAP